MEYSGQYIEISDATQEALNLKADTTYVDSQDALKANLASSNFFVSNYNRFNSNVLVDSANHLQVKNIYGYPNINIAPGASDTDITLSPTGTGKVRSAKNIDLAAGMAYTIDNVPIPTNADMALKADDDVVVKLTSDQNIAGEKTFSNKVEATKNVVITNSEAQPALHIDHNNLGNYGLQLFAEGYGCNLYSERTGGALPIFKCDSVNGAIIEAFAGSPNNSVKISAPTTIDHTLAVNKNVNITNGEAQPALHIDQNNLGNYGLQLFAGGYGANFYGESTSTIYTLLRVAGVNGTILQADAGSTNSLSISAPTTIDHTLAVNKNVNITNSEAQPAIHIDHNNLGNYGLQLFAEGYGCNLYSERTGSALPILKCAGVNGTILQADAGSTNSLTISAPTTINETLAVNKNISITNSEAAPSINIDHNNLGNYGLQMFAQGYGANLYSERAGSALPILKVAGVNGTILQADAGSTNELTIGASTTFNDELIFKEDLKMRADGRKIYFGESEEINITHVHNVGLTTNGTFTATKLNLSNLPTNASGLAAGDIYSDSGTLKIVS